MISHRRRTSNRTPLPRVYYDHKRNLKCEILGLRTFRLRRQAIVNRSKHEDRIHLLPHPRKQYPPEALMTMLVRQIANMRQLERFFQARRVCLLFRSLLLD